jgi:hypothetical protein
MKLVHIGRIVGVGAFICAASTCARTVVFAFVVAVASSSCNRSPGAPTPTPTSAQPSAPSLTRFSVAGPTSIVGTLHGPGSVLGRFLEGCDGDGLVVARERQDLASNLFHESRRRVWGQPWRG